MPKYFLRIVEGIPYVFAWYGAWRPEQSIQPNSLGISKRIFGHQRPDGVGDAGSHILGGLFEEQ